MSITDSNHYIFCNAIEFGMSEKFHRLLNRHFFRVSLFICKNDNFQSDESSVRSGEQKALEQN